jgi:uncharacterized DUF497 family protein
MGAASASCLAVSLTLEKRGLDFALAGLVFGDRHMTRVDDRRDYGEPRFISIGRLAVDVVVLVWTPRATRDASSR